LYCSEVITYNEIRELCIKNKLIFFEPKEGYYESFEKNIQKKFNGIFYNKTNTLPKSDFLSKDLIDFSKRYGILLPHINFRILIENIYQKWFGITNKMKNYSDFNYNLDRLVNITCNLINRYGSPKKESNICFINPSYIFKYERTKTYFKFACVESISGNKKN
jgi:hypothetical protein